MRVKERYGAGEFLTEEEFNEELTVRFEPLNNLSTSRDCVNRIWPRIRVSADPRLRIELI